jgi:hypothetical protein
MGKDGWRRQNHPNLRRLLQCLADPRRALPEIPIPLLLPVDQSSFPAERMPDPEVRFDPQFGFQIRDLHSRR